jgi:RND family efflux transporter MFP subunit
MKDIFRRLKFSALALSLCLLSACGQKAEEDKPTPIATIKTAVATIGAADEQVTLYGAAEPRSGGEKGLAVPVEASIDRILAPNGTRVGRGSIIITLHPSAASQLDLAKAHSEYTTAAAASARARRLRADGLVSDAEVEAARSAAHSAALTLDSLTIRASRLTLRAPIAGSVQGLTAHAGDLIPAGTTLARVVASGQLRARFGIDPALARRASAGMPISISLANGEAMITTQVTAVDKVVDAATRQAALIAQLPDGHGASPGEALKASVNIGSGGTQPSIPYIALLDEGGQSYVFVIEKGVAHKRSVTAGATQGDTVAIVTGLQGGERVAVSGGTALEDGMKVNAQ